MTETKSSTYSQDYHPTVTANHASRTAEVEGAFILKHLKPDYKILDIGCGPGSITIGFAKYVPKGHVTGVDLSKDVLDQAWANVSKESDKATNVRFEIGDAVEGLKYADASFDVVFCNQTLLHMPEPVKALREMKRVCKAGGFVAARETDFPFRWYPYTRGLQLTDKYLYDQIMGSTKVPHPQNPPYQANIRSGSLVHVWAREAGFDAAKIEKGGAAEIKATTQERAWWSQVWVGRLETGNVRERWGKLGASEEELAVMISDLKSWASNEDGWYAQLQCQVICRV